MLWVVLTLISALLFSFGDIIRKELLFKVKPYNLILVHVVLAAAIFLPIAYLNADLNVQSDVLALIAAAGLLDAIAFYFILEAFEHLEASKVTPLENISPLFLLVLAYFFLGEMLSTGQLLGVFLVIGGAIFLEWEEHFRLHELLKKSEDRTILLHVIAVMVLWSVRGVINRSVMAGNAVSPYTNLFYQLLVFSSVWVLWLYFTNRRVFAGSWKAFKKNSKFFFGSAVLSYTSYLLILLAVALPAAMISLVVPIRRLSTLFTVIFGGKILHEHRLKERAVATLIMVAGVYFIAV